MGLVHMNGRVYDPRLGRFISADPFVQAPGNTQSLNRYAYAFNNPLSYTDPSGYISEEVVDIFVAVVSIAIEIACQGCGAGVKLFQTYLGWRDFIHSTIATPSGTAGGAYGNAAPQGGFGLPGNGDFCSQSLIMCVQSSMGQGADPAQELTVGGTISSERGWVFGNGGVTDSFRLALADPFCRDRSSCVDPEFILEEWDRRNKAVGERFNRALGIAVGIGMSALGNGGRVTAATTRGRVEQIGQLRRQLTVDVTRRGGVKSRVSKSGLGDLTKAEAEQIQKVVDKAGRPAEVVGSAAKGTRRGVGTDLPIGKGAGTRSDIDVLVGPSSRGHFKGLDNQLPSIDPKSGIITGTHNPHIGPAIRFEPGAAPRSVPGVQ